MGYELTDWLVLGSASSALLDLKESDAYFREDGVASYRDPTLHTAFDFDGVLGDDSAERVYRSRSLSEYLKHESSRREEPIKPGVLKPLLADLNRIHRFEEARRQADPSYTPRLRIAPVAARSAPAHERAIHSLRDWGVQVNDAFFLGGIDKTRVLRVTQPHIFLDDQDIHLADAVEFIARVHIPYGITNEPTLSPEGTDA